MKKKIDITLVLILSIAFLLRFYKLNHDAPYFFNPDERNMASAVTRFVVPTDINRLFPCLYSEFLGRGIKTTQADCSLNPHFFAYGQFPLYLAFTSDILIKTPLSLLQGTPMMTLSTDFAAAVFWLRFWSAAASLGTVFLVYRLAIVLSLPAATSAILAAFLPGLIQSAHFGTTESLLTFFFTASLFLSIKLFNTLTSPARHFITLNKNASLLGLVTGIAAGSKLTGIFLLLPPYFALLTYSLQPLRKFRSGKWRTLKIQKLVKNIPPAAALAAFITTTTVLFFILSSPYNLIESRDFHSAVFGYEKDVAMGRYEAFYTRQFIDSQPFIFQINKVFPYSLGWPVFLLGTGGILLAFFKRKNFGFAVLLFSFFIYVIPNSLLFVKWTRFMTPCLSLRFFPHSPLTASKSICRNFISCCSFFPSCRALLSCLSIDGRIRVLRHRSGSTEIFRPAHMFYLKQPTSSIFPWACLKQCLPITSRRSSLLIFTIWRKGRNF